MPTRRSVLKVLAGAGALGAWDVPRAVAGDRRLVFVALRGGLDGLAAVPPLGDHDLRALRGDSPAVKLDAFFGLHPALVHLKTLYDARELAVFHAIGFSGTVDHAAGQACLCDGWIDLAGERPQKAGRGDDDLAPLFREAGLQLATADGPRILALDAGGWDTHVAQPGHLARRLRALDGAIAAMQGAMGEAVWRRTAVVMATEFGRTIRFNASDGTDHGAGSAAFLLGGAVRGGTVRSDWPGLTTEHLAVRTDLRALFKGVLREQMGISRVVLERRVFPGSAAVRPLTGLIRA